MATLVAGSCMATLGAGFFLSLIGLFGTSITQSEAAATESLSTVEFLFDGSKAGVSAEIDNGD